MCGGVPEDAMPTACALELIHTYSLVHDDLPAMDDDDLRRGRPTNHNVFGEDMAILAGDALLTAAFELIARNARVPGMPAANVVEAIQVVALGAGANGMVGGQVADIRADKGRWKKLSGSGFSTPAKLLEFIHINKTAALIRASLLSGAALAGASAVQKKALDTYGRAIGLAFQIQDDILDRIGDKKKLGKQGSDAKNKKLTFVSLYGLDKAHDKAVALVKSAHEALRPFGRKASFLHELADYVLNRDH
jgi:geranylgeranyl diphosphate synthase type II